MEGKKGSRGDGIAAWQSFGQDVANAGEEVMKRNLWSDGRQSRGVGRRGLQKQDSDWTASFSAVILGLVPLAFAVPSRRLCHLRPDIPHSLRLYIG